MAKKMEFPKDWSKLPEDEVCKYIEHLCKHYKKYKVTHPVPNKIQIGDVAVYVTNVRINKNNVITNYVINGRAYLCDSKIGGKISWLFSMCCDYARPSKEKLQEWWYWNGALVYALVGLVVIAGSVTELGVLTARKERAIQNKLYERKKEIPNYLEYEAALKAYEDSLNNTISMWPWKNKEK